MSISQNNKIIHDFKEIRSSFLLVNNVFQLYKKIHSQRNNVIVRLVQDDLLNELRKVVPELPVDKKLYSMAHTIFVLISQGVINIGLTHKQQDVLKELLSVDVVFNGQKGGSREEYEMTRSKWNTWGRPTINILLIILLILNTLQAYTILNDFGNLIKTYKIPISVHTLTDVDLKEETKEIAPVQLIKYETHIQEEPLDIRYAQGFGDIYNLMFSKSIEQSSLYSSMSLITRQEVERLYSDIYAELKLYSNERVQVIKYKIEKKIEDDMQHNDGNILGIFKKIIDNIYDSGIKKDAMIENNKKFITRLLRDEKRELERLYSDYLTEQQDVLEDLLKMLKTDVYSFSYKLWTVFIIELILPVFLMWVNNIISTHTCLRILKGLKISIRGNSYVDTTLESIISYLEYKAYSTKEKSRTLKMIGQGRKKRTLKRRSKKYSMKS